MKTTDRQYSVALLTPHVSRAVLEIMDYLGPGWGIFETWRSPMRQQELYDKGVTRALPMHSAHQYGLAVDIVPLKRKGKRPVFEDFTRGPTGWYWPNVSDDTWTQLDDACEATGNIMWRPLKKWDAAHVEWVGWQGFWSVHR